MKPSPPPQPAARGFTLIELLVVIAIIGILAALLLPAMGKAKARAMQAQCLVNMKNLGIAWTIYADDHDDQLVPNYGGSLSGMDRRQESWTVGWMDYSGSSGEIDPKTLIDHQKYPFGALLGPYIKDPKILKDPSDKSTVNLGRVFARARSASMNAFMNGLNLHPTGTQFKKKNDILEPYAKWVFIIEHPDSIDNPAFHIGTYASNPAALQRFNYPAGYHNGGDNVTYADGRVEFRKWKDERTVPAVKNIWSIPRILQPNNPDLQWLQDNSTVWK